MLGFFVAPVQGRPGSPQEEGNDVGAADWVVLPRASASASASMEMCSEEAAKYVWEGAIPLQIHLHESEVTTLPATPPALVLGSRIGYLPLLIPLIKPHFYSTLPPGVDTVWFDYKGLPLKWYIPTGVLFDLLCPEPERPWNLTVHFRGYPAESLTPCDGEESVKWSFINSLKEATYIINGNCKSIMNMSQADQFELWPSVLKGTLDSYCKVSSRLKFGVLREDCKVRINLQSHQGINETNTIPNQTGRIPVRLYIRNVEDADNLEDIDMIDCWEKISYINRPVGNHDEGNLFTLRHAMESLLPDCFELPSLVCNSKLATEVGEDEHNLKPTDSETITGAQSPGVEESSDANLHEQHSTQKAKIKLIRIQGITPDWEVPFAWVVNNLMNPDYFLHISLFVSVSSPGVL